MWRRRSGRRHGLSPYQARPLPTSMHTTSAPVSSPMWSEAPTRQYFTKSTGPGSMPKVFRPARMACRQSTALASMAAEDRPSPTTRATWGSGPGSFDDRLVCLVEPAALVGPGQVLVLVLAQGLDEDKAVPLHKRLVHGRTPSPEPPRGRPACAAWSRSYTGRPPGPAPVGRASSASGPGRRGRSGGCAPDTAAAGPPR